MDGAQIDEHHDEFVAAKAGDGVAFANAGGEPLCHMLKKQIANVVAQRVVERLEVIEIKEQQSALASAAGA